MCGRFTQKNTNKEFAENIYGFDEKLSLTPRHNIKPTQYAPIVISIDGTDIKTVEARWWMQKANTREWSIKFKTFNARKDGLETSFLYNPALKHRRCIVPVSSYYEWDQKVKGEPPFEFSLETKPFGLAGLWNYWFDEDNQRKHSFTVITTEPTDFINQYHNRMPIIFDNLESQETWLKKGGMENLTQYERPIRVERLADNIEVLYPN